VAELPGNSAAVFSNFHGFVLSCPRRNRLPESVSTVSNFSVRPSSFVLEVPPLNKGALPSRSIADPPDLNDLPTFPVLVGRVQRRLPSVNFFPGWPPPLSLLHPTQGLSFLLPALFLADVMFSMSLNLIYSLINLPFPMGPLFFFFTTPPRSLGCVLWKASFSGGSFLLSFSPVPP